MMVERNNGEENAMEKEMKTFANNLKICNYLNGKITDANVYSIHCPCFWTPKKKD